MAVAMPAVGARASDKYTLTRAIPADVFMAVHGRTHEGQAFVEKQYARVWKALEDARIDRDIRKLLKEVALKNGTAPEEFDNHWQTISDLITGVEWSALVKREMAMGMRIGFPTTEMVFLSLPPEGKAESTFEGLAAIFKTFADMAPQQLMVSEDNAGDTLIRRLSFKNAPFPFAFTVAKHEDVVLIGMGSTLVEQSLALLRGEGSSTLASTERYQQAFKNLPEGTDEVVFVDFDRLMAQLRVLFEKVMQQANAGGEGMDPKIEALPGKLLDAFDMFDYSAAVASTDGMKTTTHSVTRLRDNAESHALYEAFFGNGTIRDPLKYVPKESKNMSAWSGVDVPALYKAVYNFVQNNVPEGEKTIADFQQWQTDNEIDIERDYISWIEGKMTSFTLPGATPYGQGDFVFMISVSDEGKARDTLDQLFEWLTPMLEQQQVAISEAEVEGTEGFRSIVSPMLGMMGLTRPTVGVAQGRMILASSPKVIEQSLAVAAGDEPNFSQSEKLAKLAIEPKSDVCSFSYTDLSTMGEEMGQLFSMIPMIGMFGGQELMSNPGMRAVLSICGKLGPVVRQLNFFDSEVTQSTFDGKTIHSKTILTYREPPKAPEKPADGETSATEDDATH